MAFGAPLCGALFLLPLCPGGGPAGPFGAGAPGCPAADFIMEDVRQKLVRIEGPEAVDLRLVFDPVWCYDMMSEEAKLELGFL